MSFLNGTDPGLRQTRTPNVDTFAAGVGFTAGSSTTVTLTADPSTENNLIVTFDGITQHRDTYSVSGTTVTFDAAVPSGVLKIECTYTTSHGVSTPGDATVGTSKLVDGAVTEAKMAGGLHTIWIPAQAMTVSVNAPSADITSVDSGSANITVPVLDFDGGSSDEVATFNVAFPKSWNAGTITARFFWTNSNANAGNVVWGIQGLCVVDSGALDTAMGTDVTVQDANITTAGNLMVSATTGIITLSGASDNGVSFFNVFRDASDTSNDTYASDARLIGVQLFYTTNTGGDT